MDKLRLDLPIKYNHVAHEIRAEKEIERDEVNALFSLGLDLAIGWRPDKEFGMVLYKERTRGYLH